MTLIDTVGSDMDEDQVSEDQSKVLGCQSIEHFPVTIPGGRDAKQANSRFVIFPFDIYKTGIFE